MKPVVFKKNEFENGLVSTKGNKLVIFGLSRLFRNEMNWWMFKQDSRLATADFSPEYRTFDQHVQTVLNETTVCNLVFERFLQSSIPTLDSIIYAKDFAQISCLTTKKFCCGTLRCLRKMQVLKNFMHKKGISLFSVEKILSHSAKESRRGTVFFQKTLVSEISMHRGGGEHNWSAERIRFVEKFLSHRTEKLQTGTLLSSTKTLKLFGQSEN